MRPLRPAVEAALVAAVAAAERPELVGRELPEAVLVLAAPAAGRVRHLLLREQRRQASALEFRRQAVLHYVEVAGDRFAVHVPILVPAIAYTNVEVGRVFASLEELEAGLEVPPRVVRVEKRGKAIFPRNLQRRLQDPELVPGVRRGQDQEDAPGAAPQELAHGRAVAHAAVGHVEHPGRHLPHKVELRQLLELPDHRVESEEAQARRVGEEAKREEDH
mmetsp:Transcript_49776/g.144429  ORF Transcript_49776/g.144429 Transcript_49776/m.144429 type:complete len:219 (+) Transcript_49776:297-953(+)